MGTIKFLFLVLLTQLLSVWFSIDRQQQKEGPPAQQQTTAPAQAAKPEMVSWTTIMECIRQERFFF